MKDENLAKVRAQAMSEDFKQRVINNDLKKQERVLRISSARRLKHTSLISELIAADFVARVFPF